MKKVICSIVLLMSISLVSFSQDGGKRQPRGDRKDFAKELNLSDEQKTKVKELDNTYRTKMNELKKNSSISNDERRKQMRDLSDQKHNDMKKILTDDQIVKLDARRDNRPNLRSMPKVGNGNFQNVRPMRFGNPMDSLNLTEEQKSKMKDLSEKYAEKTKTLRDDHRKAIDGILTADQKAKLDTLKSARPNMQNRGKGNRPNMGQNIDCPMMPQLGELPQDVKMKLEELESNFVKERQTIRNSRITVEMQNKRIAELRKKYREDKRELLKDFCPLQEK